MRKSVAAPVLGRLDVCSAVALVPFISFFFRRPMYTYGDALEFGIVLFITARMFLSATSYLPLTRFEASQRGVLLFVGIFILLNALIAFVPALRRRI